MSNNQSVSNLMQWEECISNLEFITSIPKGHKPCYNTQTTISKDSWFTTVRRRWGGEKGEYGIIHVNKVLGSCDHHYRMCLKKLGNLTLDDQLNTEYSNVTMTIQQLHTALTNPLEGFSNLILTYKDQKEIFNNYIECKNKVIFLIGLIDEYFIEQRNRRNEEQRNRRNEEQYEQSDSSDEDYFGNYFSWGVTNDTFDIEKNPMVISLVVSMDSSKDKPSFFSTNNMVLLKAKRKNSKQNAIVDNISVDNKNHHD